MQTNFDILALVILAFGVIGTVEWCKGIFGAIKLRQWHGIWISVVSLVSCFLVAWAFSSWKLEGTVTVGIVLLAMVELGYQVIVQTVLGQVKKLIPPAPPADVRPAAPVEITGPLGPKGA